MLGSADDDRDHCRYGSVDLAAGDCVERQVQVRAGGEHCPVRSPLLHLLQHSRALQRDCSDSTVRPLSESIYRTLAEARRQRAAKMTAEMRPRTPSGTVAATWLRGLCWCCCGRGGVRRVPVRWVCCGRCTGREYVQILKGALAHFSAGQCVVAAGRGVDDSGRGGDRLSSAAGAHCAAAGADCGFGSGDGAVPCHAAGADTDGRRTGHRVDCADAAGDAVVHPVQCDCGSDGDSFGLEGGGDAVPLHHGTALADGDSAGHLSVSDYGAGDGFGRGMECQHYRGILSI